MDAILPWPPPFQLRPSRRAKSVSLRICPYAGLQLIVPVHFDPAASLAILSRHRRWIERAWARVKPHPQAKHGASLPQELHLQAIAETWRVSCCVSLETSKAVLWTAAPHHRLILTGKTHHRALVRNALKAWLQQQAKVHLVPWLVRLSHKHQLPYTAVSLRQPKTRWGSCSAKKRISLNSKLLFLPKELVEYVMLHELCHTIHLNHSPRFWRLLASLQPNYQQLQTQLKEAYYYVPLIFEER